MATYKNFYETIDEALIRLRNTIVVYDGEPYHIWTICEHPDGIFRVYMTPVEEVQKAVIPCLHGYSHGSMQLAGALDKHVDGKVQCGCTIVRKMMNSPLFNRFKPFQLGMVNEKGSAIYLERKPLRPKTEQGLTHNMIDGTLINMSPMTWVYSPFTEGFRDCVLGHYPSPKECLAGLTADNINSSVGFHRNFALVKGPIESLYLAYKSEIIGFLPRGDFSVLKLGRQFKHMKETVQDLNLIHVID